MNNEALNQLTSQERLQAYQLITAGCTHLFSKGKLQENKFEEMLQILIPLTKKDPYFLAHLTSYAYTHSDSKALKIMTALANALSDADGAPFSSGSEYKKPNLRYVSAAAVQKLEPKNAEQLLLIVNNKKYGVSGYVNHATHFPQAMRTAFKRYLQYREANPPMLKGISEAGLNPTIRKMHKVLRVTPSDEVAKIIHYRKKGKKLEFEKRTSFEGMTDLEVAETIRDKKLPVLGTITALGRPISPVIAVALLEQATGNQAIILRKTFEDAGVLKDEHVMKLFQAKMKEAKTAVDRIENLSKNASEEVQKAMKEARADVRRQQIGDIGKVFLHVDASPSMEPGLEVAMKRAAIIAELVPNPKENFMWGLFHNAGEVLPLPDKFVEDAFRAILYGKTTQYSTDAFALYPTARQFGADVDVYITDGGHNVGSFRERIRTFHESNPAVPKPKAVVIVWIRTMDYSKQVQDGFEQNQIPVAVISPEALTETALVAQTVRNAMLGPVATVDEIMNTELLKLPEWYFTL